MADNNINPCTICVRMTLIFINILYLLVAVCISGVGIFFLIQENNLSFIIGRNLAIVSIFILAIGLVIAIMAIMGIIGAASNFWPFLAVYSFVLSLLILGQLAIVVLDFTYRADIEDQVDKQLLVYIQNYTTYTGKYYNAADNAVIDTIQTALQCCGLTGPSDWLLYNPVYTIVEGVPISCQCSDSSNTKCQTILYSDVGVWKQGCKETFYDFVDKNLLAIGGTLLGFTVFQFLTLLLSIGSCSCGIMERHGGSRRYETLQNIQSSDSHMVDQVITYNPQSGPESGKFYDTEYSQVV